MSRLAIDRATKRYGEIRALDDVTLAIAEGEFFGLIGPSGSGKTTLLRAIAGFVALDAGRIALDDRDIEALPVHKREIGMVFQSYALFPHLSVFDNIAFGLAVRGIARSEIESRVRRALDLVRLAELGERRPRQLSGGQQQRVALARALVTEPRILLLDEPLSALDRHLRQEMQVELRNIQRRIGITTIFVTHDQEEALTLSDRIAIFNQGRIVQSGPPRLLYEAPIDRFAAGFLGEANFLEGRIRRLAGGEAEIELALGGWTLAPAPAWGGQIGDAVILALRPEKIDLTAGPLPAGPNCLRGHVRAAIFSGASFGYRIAIGEQILIVFVPNRVARPFAEGEEVTLSWEVAHNVAVRP